MTKQKKTLPSLGAGLRRLAGKQGVGCALSGPGLPGNWEGGGAQAAGVWHRSSHTDPRPTSARAMVKLGYAGKYIAFFCQWQLVLETAFCIKIWKTGLSFLYKGTDRACFRSYSFGTKKSPIWDFTKNFL